MESITIFLNDSIHAQSYDIAGEATRQKSTLVHNIEFAKVKSLIDGFIPDTLATEQRENLHNTITILGTRGSGKTSFLLTIKNELSKNEIGEKIQILDIIDPTLIEEKGHVFLNVIAIIKDLIDKKLNKQECDPRSEPVQSRKEWRTALNKLAAGLPSIDGVGSNGLDSWQDPEFVMDNGLKAVHASKELAANFNEFLRLSLDVLKKKAFLVMFDDIDVDATKGWAVLETIRKYFTGARLITIVSGDSQLYSTVVRQKKWQNFGKEILKYEGRQLGKLPVFNEMITELESQYLQKVLQPRNRIHLSTIGTSKRYNKNKNFYVYEKSGMEVLENESENEISKIYERILKYFGINNSYQTKAYRDYLLELPLRTQVQFLNLFKLNTGDYIQKNTGIAPFTDIFLSDLYANEININTLIRSPKNINRLILDFLLKAKKLEELYQLQPITTEDTLNASLLSLNFILSYNIQNDPYLIFDYFIKIGYTRNLLPLLGYKSSIESTTNPSIDDLCNNTVILNDNVLKDVVGKITAYMRGLIANNSGSEKMLKAGTIPLFGLAANTKKDTKATSDRIDSVLKAGNADYFEQMMVYMPLSSNQYVYKQASLLTYSPYLLLGAIGELIRKDKPDEIKKGFTELSQFRGYMMPDFKRGEIKEEIGNVQEDPQDLNDRQSLKGFDIESAFSNWVQKYPEYGIKISVHLLGKIATRFFYALTNLESKVGNKNLGEVFHAYILAFMNAVLVEDCRENADDLASELNLNNTNYKDDVFINNISKLIDRKTYEGKSKSLHFSQWMLACPLLLAYLKKDEIKESIKIFCHDYLKNENGIVQDDILNIDLRKFLDKIPIKGDDKEITFVYNELEEISLNRKSKYRKILRVLDSNNFNIDRFYKGYSVRFENDLGRLGIVNVSEESIEKFILFFEQEL